MASTNDSVTFLSHIIPSDSHDAHNHGMMEHAHDHADHVLYNNGTSNGQSNESNDVLIAKVTAMLVLFTASMLCGMIPFKLSQWIKWTDTSRNHGASMGSNGIVTMLLAFGGGVLLCTTFLHMLPEVEENIEALRHSKQLPVFLNGSSIHLAPLLMCVGFFAMYFVEELVHLYLHRLKHRRSHTHGRSNDEHGCDAQSINDNYHTRFSNKKKTSISVAELISPDGNDIENGNVVGVNYSSNPLHCTLPKNSALDINENGNMQYEYDRRNIQIMACQPKNTSGNGIGSAANAVANDLHAQECESDNHHSHLPFDAGDDDDLIVSSLRGLLIVLALSVHELFEGLAVGLESSSKNVWYMFGAVATHKLVIAFCVSVELIVNKTRYWLATLYICTFAIVSPIGIGIGLWISHGGNADEIRRDENLLIFDSTDGLRNDEEHHDHHAPNMVAVLLQGLATGTLLYVVFFEILIKSRATAASTKRKACNGLLQYASVLIGFVFMFGMQFLGTCTTYSYHINSFIWLINRIDLYVYMQSH